MGRLAGLALVLVLFAGCGSDDSSEAATAAGGGGTEEPDAAATEPEVDTAPSDIGTVDGGTATLTLDGVDYEFDVEFCVRSPFGMSGFGRGPNDEKLTFSYETGDPNDNDVELDNSIRFDTADRNADWRAGSVTGSLPSNWGSLLITLQENTIEGTGGFENVYDPDSLPVDGAFSITCE